MEFNFDSEKSIEITKTPSVKAINDSAGLWIADENVEICQREKNCLATCSLVCNHHYRNTIPHNIKTDKVNEEGEDIVIPLNVILNP